MSRIGKEPIQIPTGVEVKFNDAVLTAKGKLGEKSVTFPSEISVELADGKITVKPVTDTREARCLWGTFRSMAFNLVEGVSNGFTKSLQINGVGYRAAMQGKDLVLQLGFSHEVRYSIPEGITIKCEKPTLLHISGIDKQKVGQAAAEIRSWRPPEPYKGKGVRYTTEKVLRKEGKKK